MPNIDWTRVGIFSETIKLFSMPLRAVQDREPVFLLEDLMNAEVERKSERSDGLPPTKQSRIDENDLIAAVVLAYAANVDAVDVPTTHAQAMASNDAGKWSESMDIEMPSHEQSVSWTLVPRKPTTRAVGCR